MNGKTLVIVRLVILCLCFAGLVSPTNSVDTLKEMIFNMIENRNGFIMMENQTVSQLNDTMMNSTFPATNMMAKLRVKRQSSGGKYTDAAKMPQVKVLRLVLQMIRNTWSSVYVGGAHPLHHEVPKPLVELTASKIINYFFPKVGEPDKTQ